MLPAAARGVSSSANWACTDAAAECQPSWSNALACSASVISSNAHKCPSSEDTGDGSKVSKLLSNAVASGYIKLPVAPYARQSEVTGVDISGEFGKACSFADGNEEGMAMTGDGCTKWLTPCKTGLVTDASQGVK